MSTQFFERQEAQKTYTRWLVWAFIAAILAVVLVINLVLIVGLGGAHPFELVAEEPWFVFWTSLVVLVVIFGACWHKSSEMRAGGAAVARAVGGVPVTSDDADLKRKRLLNIVEEMAIAARIRKPQVFVLPEEMGINAFAAGHSPDEAAVAVTQGALDQLDRDQLQAVIGHEFSHILNGDMKINMRLTAWVFGLLVITELAGRVMRGRSRGKGAARIKAIAFGVFLAGSIGMLAGRLLQAAVSRRREHLADASSVQFTRNPEALQRAFIIMAASAEGTAIENPSSSDMAHMFFAGSASGWMAKFGGLFATHPPIEERVRALDSRVTRSRFKSLVSEERRKIFARAQAEGDAGSQAGDAQATPAAGSTAALADDALEMGAMDAVPANFAAAAQPRPVARPDAPTPKAGAVVDTGAVGNAPAAGPHSSGNHLSLADTFQTPALSETLPTGVRMIAGRALPPDVLRNRLSQDQQAGITGFIASVELNPLGVQGAYIAGMLAAEPAKWRTQLTKLAPVLGIELFKETQAQIPRIAALAPAARLPLLTDLLSLLDGIDPAHRKRLRGVARAFAPTVVAGDMFRHVLTRILEKKLAKAVAESPPVPLPERAQQIGEVYATLAHCRFGAAGGKQALNAYRAGLMGMLPPQKWLSFPEAPLAPLAIDAALAGIAQIHPTGKRSFSEGMARVVAVGGVLTVPQVDFLRGVCLLVDCQVPVIPPDVVYEDMQASLGSPAAKNAHVKAR